MDPFVYRVLKNRCDHLGLLRCDLRYYDFISLEQALTSWAFVINGSPRKKWNTAQAIDKAGEALNICNTYQFKDYSRYDITLFNEEDKRAYRDSRFEGDLKKAYELGCRIAERAKKESSD